MDTVTSAIDIELSPHDCIICQMGGCSNPYFHVGVFGRINDELSLLMIIVSSCSDSTSVGAMLKLSQSKTADVTESESIFEESLVLCGSQGLDGFAIEEEVDVESGGHTEVELLEGVANHEKLADVVIIDVEFADIHDLDHLFEGHLSDLFPG